MESKTKFQFNNFSLKILACIFMLVDHIAMILIPQSHPVWLIMRIIGRLSAPIFFYTLAEGLKRTSNRRKYLGRLFVASVIMAAGNGLVALLGRSMIDSPPSIVQPNIFIIMLLIALAIDSLETFTNKTIIRNVAVSASALICVILLPGYQWLAISTVFCFYFIEKAWIRDLAYIVSSLLICLLTQQYIQIFMVLSILFINNSSNEKPKRNMKLFFYLFYPLHLWALYCLSIII